jgi:hypothetical protein
MCMRASIIPHCMHHHHPSPARTHTRTHTRHLCTHPPPSPPLFPHRVTVCACACVCAATHPPSMHAPPPLTHSQPHTHTHTHTQACVLPRTPSSRVPSITPSQPHQRSVTTNSFVCALTDPPSLPITQTQMASVSDALHRTRQGGVNWRLLLHGCCCPSGAATVVEITYLIQARQTRCKAMSFSLSVCS